MGILVLNFSESDNSKPPGFHLLKFLFMLSLYCFKLAFMLSINYVVYSYYVSLLEDPMNAGNDDGDYKGYGIRAAMNAPTFI